MPPREREAVVRKMGVLFQAGALFDSLPVWQNVGFGLMHRDKMAPATARGIAVKTLAAVGLTPDTADLLPAELSGGMQKRVALARAIVGSPEILVLDSPTDGLDPIVTTHIDKLIVGALERLKAAALTITQDIDSGRRIGDRAALLWDGKIRWQGPMAELERVDDPDVRLFLGRANNAAGQLLSSYAR
jgi:phospholipid/cholesterol/gamma-HCH transport system ATP-binding protein